MIPDRGRGFGLAPARGQEEFISIVIPVKTGIQDVFRALVFLDAPVSSTGQAYQARHDPAYGARVTI